MGRHEVPSTPLQVLYLGSSAQLGTLRRALEAHGVITRSRLTPALDAIIADPSIADDHPTVLGAHSLGIPLLSPDDAITRFARWMPRLDLTRPASRHPRSTRPRTR